MDKQLPTVNWQGQAVGLLSICLNMHSCSIAFLHHEWSTEQAKKINITTEVTTLNIERFPELREGKYVIHNKSLA